MGIKAKIASLVVEVAANSATFNSELKKSKKETHQWAKEVKGYAKVGAGALAASAVAAGAGLAVLTDRAFDNIDALAKHSDKISTSTQALAGLRHQGELNGVAQRALDVGLQRSTRRISEAAKGTSVASAALAELGLNAQELNKLSPDQQFYQIADAMEKVDNQTDKVRLGFKLFDSEGVGLINAMRGGSEELAKAAKEAEQLGISVNRIDAAKIEAANDASYKADMAMQGLGNTIAVGVAPVITAMKTEFVEAAKSNNGFRDQVNAGMKIVVKAVGFAGNAVRGMQVVWKGAQLLVATYTATTLQNLEAVTNKVVEFANILPGVNIKLDPNSGISGLAAASSHQVSVLKAELHELAIAKLPSEGVQEWFDEVQAKAKKAAELVAAANQPAAAKSNSAPDFSTGSEAEKVAAELNRGNEHYIEAYERRQKIIDNALAAKQVSEDRHFEISKSNWANYQQAIAESEAQTRAANIAGSKTFFANMATLTDSGNKRLARIGRAAARVNITISTIEAAMSSYKWAASWGGPVAGAIAASAAVAAGAVRLRQLNKGTVSSSSGGSGGLSGQTTFDQALPNSGASISSIPDAAQRRNENRPHIENYYAPGAIQAIDTQSFDDRIRESRQTVAESTEEYLQENGHSLIA